MKYGSSQSPRLVVRNVPSSIRNTLEKYQTDNARTIDASTNRMTVRVWALTFGSMLHRVALKSARPLTADR